MMTPRAESTIEELHRIRRELAAKFGGDLFAINADAQVRTLKSGRRIIRRSTPTATDKDTGIRESAPSVANSQN